MRNDTLDLQAIDMRTLPAEHRDAVMREATRRAHLERSRVFHALMSQTWRGVSRGIRRLRPAGRAAAILR